MVAKSAREKKRKNKTSILSAVALAFLLIFGIGFLGLTNWRIQEQRAQLEAQVERLRKEIADTQQKNEELKKNIDQANSKDYLEKVAREQFGLKAPGEQVVVVNKEQQTSSPTPTPRKSSFDMFRSWLSWIKQEIIK